MRLFRPHRLTVRTPGSHPGNPGSIPGEAAIYIIYKILYNINMEDKELYVPSSIRRDWEDDCWEMTSDDLCLCIPMGQKLPMEPSVSFGYPDGKKEWVQTTARNLDDYEKLMPGVLKACENPSFSIVEIGAGLGELIPFLAERQPAPSLTVIDPADYTHMLGMIEEAIVRADEMELSEAVQQRLAELRRRCLLYMDATRVRLLNMPLSWALEEVPSIHQEFNVIVDCCGSALYSHVDMGSEFRIDTKNSIKRVIDLQGQLAHKLSQSFRCY